MTLPRSLDELSNRRKFVLDRCFGGTARNGVPQFRSNMKRTLLSAVKVKHLRLQLGLQQAQAAKAAGWQRCQSWHKLETRNTDVRVSTLATVARVLGCGIDDLLVTAKGSSRSALRYRSRRAAQDISQAEP